MRVRFTDVFDFTPVEDRRVTVVFRPDGGPLKDGVYTVTRACGREAVKAGKAVAVTTRARRSDDAGRG